MIKPRDTLNQWIDTLQAIMELRTSNIILKRAGRGIKFSKGRKIDFISPNRGLSRHDSTIGRRAKLWLFLTENQRNVSLTASKEAILKQKVDFLLKPS